MQYEIIKYKKTGAEFASGEEANTDRMSVYPAEMLALMESTAEEMKRAGTWHSTTYRWDQPTQTLTILRIASDIQLYRDAMEQKGIDKDAYHAPMQERGWEMLGSYITEEEPVF